MLVSFIIPAYRAEATMARALRGLIAQTVPDWEALIVSDDGADYGAYARAAGVTDPRLRFVASGGLRSGCHRARNAGLAEARGDLVLHCDADDVSHARRLEALLPIACERGAAVDNPRVVDDASGRCLYRAFADDRDLDLDVAAFLATTVPLFPLIRREFAAPRLENVENLEDVVANLRLIDHIGSLPVLARSLSDYHVVKGSMSAGDDAAAQFDDAYGAVIARLASGDGLRLSPAIRDIGLAGLRLKQALNRDFGAAAARQAGLTFQAYIAQAHRDGRHAPTALSALGSDDSKG